jgi:integration host factor subunit alpha
MTKSEIVAAVYGKVGGFSKKEAADIVELVFETVKETLGRGEKIKISGFGNFVLRDKRQRRGRNPQTGKPLTITERRVLTFKASQILKSILNPDDPEERPEDRARALEHIERLDGASGKIDAVRNDGAK